jgi:succinyl-CoA synthetase beta subunit
VNIFGGIVRCDEVARGIVSALDKVDIASQIVLRLDGTNVAEARRIIDERASEKIISERTMLSAARRAVELAGTPKSQGGTEL